MAAVLSPRMVEGLHRFLTDWVKAKGGSADIWDAAAYFGVSVNEIRRAVVDQDKLVLDRMTLKLAANDNRS